MPPRESPIAVGLEIDLVTAWIEGLKLGALPPFSFSRLGDGQSNLTYLVSDAAGHSWVLRRPPLGVLLPSAHDVAREHLILKSLAAAAVPIPRQIALRPADANFDVPLVLMENVEGIVIDNHATLAETSISDRRKIGLSLASTLATIHAVDLKATGLESLASHKPYAERQLKRWSRQLEDSKTQDRPLIEELTERLRRKIPEQTETTLVHGDYHLLNVIVDPTAAAVKAVIDWELSTLGDPLADLGCLLAYWPEADDPVLPAPSDLPTQPGFPRRSELVAAYAEASGRDVSAIGFWETLCCWKVAIIGEGVLRRRLDEPGNGDPESSAELVERVLARTALAAEAAGI